ncbi:hypothetical protein ANN_10659 [Periplaneta americana]|uniref:Tc1-like transposase DDE domain-containing protein n=1 Tax=Periplaneta americana TaxID=6978 RepID=A0ABQ8T3K0_PERAM|nr:hypothetical protein ANN_10659 [Periplaneta americana]
MHYFFCDKVNHPELEVSPSVVSRLRNRLRETGYCPGTFCGCHRDFLRENEIEVMEWPAISPDLNATEHLWDILDRKVRNPHQAPQTLQELGDALKEEWENIPQEEIQNLIGSMSRRCQAVSECCGRHTRY